MFSIDCLYRYYLTSQHTKRVNITPLSSTYLLILYNFMNIIHTCITIRLNYPMTLLYHHNKTYVCASSRYEIIIHKQYLAQQYTILYTPLDLLYKYLVQYGSTIHFIFISELYYFLLDFFLLGFAACLPFAGPAAFTKELFKLVATIRATSALGVVTIE